MKLVFSNYYIYNFLKYPYKNQSTLFFLSTIFVSDNYSIDNNFVRKISGKYYYIDFFKFDNFYLHESLEIK